jgi:hypothetical protein
MGLIEVDFSNYLIGAAPVAPVTLGNHILKWDEIARLGGLSPTGRDPAFRRVESEQ